MKAESTSPAEGRERVAYKPFISVISSLAAEFSLNKTLTIVACFQIAPGLLKLETFLVFYGCSQHREALAVPVQNTGQPLPDLLKIQPLQVNYTSNIY